MKVQTFSNTPDILPSLYYTSIRRPNILSRSNDREWHGFNQITTVFSILVVVDRWV